MPRNREKPFELRNLGYLNERISKFLKELDQNPVSYFDIDQKINTDWWTAVLANMQLYLIDSSLKPRLFSPIRIKEQEETFRKFKDLSYQIFLIENRPAELPEIRNGNKLLSEFLSPGST